MLTFMFMFMLTFLRLLYVLAASFHIAYGFIFFPYMYCTSILDFFLSFSLKEHAQASKQRCFPGVIDL